MKVTPVSYTTEMVLSVKAGRKHLTRRLVSFRTKLTPQILDRCAGYIARRPLSNKFLARCPYGGVGDKIWIREEHLLRLVGDVWECEFKDGYILKVQASELDSEQFSTLLKRKTLGQWQRARFLPRKFARTFLTITAVCLERLQAISDADCVLEGIQSRTRYREKGRKPMTVSREYAGYPRFDKKGQPTNVWFDSPRESFKSLWTMVHGEESWEQNPWVWVIKFKEP